MSAYSQSLINLLLYSAVVMMLVIVMLVLSYILGERHREPATDEPYESGIVPTGSARLRFSAQFYIIAMFFVIFDLESVFLVAWAISFRDVGWGGFGVAILFIGLLVSALVYEWRIGAFEFATSGKKILKALQKQQETEKL